MRRTNYARLGDVGGARRGGCSTGAADEAVKMSRWKTRVGGGMGAVSGLGCVLGRNDREA
jgi:hypothetical protein